MDRKTLEYMAIKVAKSKSLIEKIDKLRRSMQLNEKDTYAIIFRCTGSSFEIEERYQPELFSILKANFTKSAAAEIERLEQELAEL